MAIKAFLFDIGNVLVRFDHSRAVARLQAQSECSAAEIRAVVDGLIAPLESGRLSSEDFLAQAVSGSRFQGSAEAFRDIYCDIFESHELMWKLVDQLAAQFPLYLFSNTSEIHLAFVRERYPVFGKFTDGVFSMRVGAMKPEQKIYDAAIELMGVEPESVFYIDDLVPNTAEGTRVGFHSHTYDWRQHDALLTDIAATAGFISK